MMAETSTRKDPVDPAVGVRVRELRDAQSLTQGELATKADCDEGYLSKIERGERRAGKVVLRKIAGALGTSYDYLRTGNRAAIETTDGIDAKALARGTPLFAELTPEFQALYDRVARFERTPDGQQAERSLEWWTSKIVELRRQQRELDLDMDIGPPGAVEVTRRPR